MVGSYPRLIAASYALHRLPAPRHPPCALSNLTTIILASLAIRPAWRPYGTGDKNPSRLAAGRVVTPQTPPHKLRSGFLLATLPLFIFQRTRHPCRSQARKPSMPQRLLRLRSALTPSIADCRMRIAEFETRVTLAVPALAGILQSSISILQFSGGADGIRTHDLLVANQALSQLSYGPLPLRISECRLQNSGASPNAFRTVLHSAIFNLHSALEWWAQVESNHRPRPYQGRALAN